MTWLYLLFSSAAIFGLAFGIAWLLFHCASMIYGAPYVVTPPSKRSSAVAWLAGQQKVAEIGSGNGEMLLRLAKGNSEVHGYEINPFLVWVSRRRIRKAGLSDRVFAHWQNLWQASFAEYDGIYIYGLPFLLEKLERKLAEELRPGSKVASIAFPFPHWEAAQEEGRVFLYEL